MQKSGPHKSRVAIKPQIRIRRKVLTARYRIRLKNNTDPTSTALKRRCLQDATNNLVTHFAEDIGKDLLSEKKNEH